MKKNLIVSRGSFGMILTVFYKKRKEKPGRKNISSKSTGCSRISLVCCVLKKQTKNPTGLGDSYLFVLFFFRGRIE